MQRGLEPGWISTHRTGYRSGVMSSMVTDRPPSNQERLVRFRRSDRLDALEVPDDDRLIVPAKSVETAMDAGQRTAVRLACGEFLGSASALYRVSQPSVRVLAARPLRLGSLGSSGSPTP